MKKLLFCGNAKIITCEHFFKENFLFIKALTAFFEFIKNIWAKLSKEEPSLKVFF
jgi:hypothetical protein